VARVRKVITKVSIEPKGEVRAPDAIRLIHRPISHLGRRPREQGPRDDLGFRSVSYCRRGRGGSGSSRPSCTRLHLASQFESPKSVRTGCAGWPSRACSSCRRLPRLAP
jgi:hypothetical protein